MNVSEKDKQRFWEKVDVRGPDECWEWSGSRKRRGYGQFHLGDRIQAAHRVSARIAGMGIKNLCVCHRCDNPPCVNPRHLFVGTNADNVRDRNKKGRTRTGRVRGEKHGAAKLTREQVLEIRRCLENGENQTRLARRFGVARVTIYFIKNRETWSHI